jgi:TolA-binding protein
MMEGRMRNLPFGGLRHAPSVAPLCAKLAITLFSFAALLHIPSLAARDAPTAEEATASQDQRSTTRVSGDELAAGLATLRRELTDLRAKVVELEGETLQVRDTLATIQQEPAPSEKTQTTAKSDTGDRTAVVEVLAKDLLSVREELADVRTRLARSAGSSEQVAVSRPVPDVDVTGSISKTPAKAHDGPATAARRHTVLSPAAVQAWLTRADELLRLGDVSGARLALQPTVDVGNGLGAFKLAETYDPKRLSEWRVIGMKADTAKARELYELAQATGMASAGDRLAALPR